MSVEEYAGSIRSTFPKLIGSTFILHIFGIIIQLSLMNFSGFTVNSILRADILSISIGIVMFLDYLIIGYLVLYIGNFYEYKSHVIILSITVMIFTMVTKLVSLQNFTELVVSNPLNLGFDIILIAVLILLFIGSIVLLYSTIAFFIINKEGLTYPRRRNMIILSFGSAILIIIGLFTLLLPILSILSYLFWSNISTN